jgi:hypothetical protein
MTRTYLYHNLGLGDHIICNALVRNCVLNEGLIHLFAKKHNAESVRFMFRDIDVTVVEVFNDVDVETELDKRSRDKVIRIGCTGYGWSNRTRHSFDEKMYAQAKLNISERWDGFKYEPLERKPSDKMYCDENDDFILIHEDKERGYKINDCWKSKFNEIERGVIEPKKTTCGNIFMWDIFLLHAIEIHCINSSFLLLADSIPTKGKLYFHKYARNEGDFCVPKLRKDWTIIE